MGPEARYRHGRRHHEALHGRHHGAGIDPRRGTREGRGCPRAVEVAHDEAPERGRVPRRLEFLFMSNHQYLRVGAPLSTPLLPRDEVHAEL